MGIFLQYQRHMENAEGTALGDSSLSFCIGFRQLLWVTLAFSAKTQNVSQALNEIYLIGYIN